MVRSIAVYGLVLAGLALALEWLEYRHVLRMIDTDVYALSLAILFTGIGVWIGARLAPAKAEGSFRRNDLALRHLGISPRENEVLELLAQGHSNKEIARLLGIAPNTVKSHVAGLLGKLEASRRTQAIRKARALGILP